MKIAIIGKSFRLPKDIDSFDSLYETLISKTDCIDYHPKDRFNIKNYYDKDNSIGKMRTEKAGYTNNIYDFDADFFNISPKEAKTMDPQQRIMLELIYECIEDSQINMKNIKGTKTGVFMGSCSMEYFNAESEDAEFCNEYSITGGLLTLLSNRISYFYDLKGPSLTLDTACSSSGHALHLACQSIINGESEMCFVGGSNILISPETFVGFSQATMLSPDGKCKTFDDNANGYVRGEGFVSLLLKPLEKAIEDNDKIYAVINKTGINQDGKTDSITMPNPKAQMDLLEDLYQDEDLNNLIYIEAHGTGTLVGDYNETLSIGTVLGKNKKDKLNIGSIKTNLGHTEASSGLVSILKICLMMEKNQLLPNINFEIPNQKIDFNNLNLNVVTDVIPFKKDKVIMGVNNFGFGGANFHCVLENYNKKSNKKISFENNKVHLLAVHGVNEEGINNEIIKWLNYKDDVFLKYLYNQNKNKNLPQLGESKIFVVENKNEFENIIYNDNKDYLYTSFSDAKLDTAFVFCGQGPQYIDMGIEFCEKFPVFLDAILNCEKNWREFTRMSFIEKYKLFLPKFKDVDRNLIKINEPCVAQPALFFYQVALFELYKSFNILPDAVIGHSAGELAAFHVSGAIDIKDCIKILYYRSLYQQETYGLGNMIAANISYQEFEKLRFEGKTDLELACENDVNSVVLSGSKSSILKMKDFLDEEGIFNSIIRGECPFHSSYQEVIKDRILNNIKNIKFNKPKIKLISSTFGAEVKEYKQDYWWRNIREKVSFHHALELLNFTDIFVEIGPHPVLANNIKNIFKDVEVFSSSNRKKLSSKVFMSTLANLWAAGHEINLEHFGIKNNKYYPKISWNHKKFVNIPMNSINRRQGKNTELDLIEFSTKKYPYILDHIIDKKFIFPTVGYFDIIMKYFGNNSNILLKNFEIKNIYLPDNLVQFRYTKKDNKLILKSHDNITEYLNTEIYYNSKESNEKFKISGKIDESKFNIKLNQDEAYQILKNKSYNFGNKMKSIEYILINENSSLIKLIDLKLDTHINPILLDAGLLSSVLMNGITNDFIYLPVSIDTIEIYKNSQPLYVYSEFVEYNLKYLVTNVTFYNKDMVKVASYKNLRANNISDYQTDCCYQLKYNKVKQLENSNIKEVYYYGEETVLPYQKIDKLDIDVKNLVYCKSRNLFKLKDDINIIEANENIENVYFLIKDDISLGFLRSYINESNKNIIIIISETINKDKILDIIDGKYDDKNEYFIIDDNVHNIELVEYQTKNINTEKYYFNRNKNKFSYYPIVNIPDYDVIVKVKASALNFKDLMVSLGIVKEEFIGYEASGIVVDSKTNNYQVGDEVIICNNNIGKTIGNYVYCKNNFIFKKSNNLSFIEASSIIIIFCTVYISLIERVNIKENDTVLIHSATGGIGQAAIQVCRMLGANVIATAGSEEKRNLLKNEYNIDCVTNSRNPEDFKKDILEYTENKGVDVILNSLAGDSLIANFEILKEGGSMIELGKRDALEKNNINLSKFLDSITYTSVHFDRLYNNNSKYIHQIINKVLKLFEENKLKPIKIEKFHISKAEEAIKYMSKGQHMGKIVLEVDDWLPENYQQPTQLFDFNKYYLITGGLGGLGLELMNWMYTKGANNFILTSRNGKISERGERIIKNLKNNNCNIYIAIVDIANFDEFNNYLIINNLIDKIDGVFHLAGNIKDNLIKNMDESNILDVVKPKVEGCKNLGKIFENHNLKHFVCFSSISALVGNPGQSAYAAANTFLDNYCKNLGKKGLSVNIGAVGATGMIHNDFNLAKSMMANNFSFIHYKILFDNLGKVLLDENTNNIIISNQDWNKLAINYPKLELLNNYKKEIVNDNILSVNAKEEIVEYIKKLVEIDKIETDINLTKYGVDSMMSIQISSWLKESYSFNISQLQILQGITIDEILSKFSNITKSDEIIKNITKIKKFSRKSEFFEPDISDEFIVVENKNNVSSYLIILGLVFGLVYYKFYL